MQDVHAQSEPVVQEQELETLASSSEDVSEDDFQLQELERYRKNRININTVLGDELKSLGMVTDLHIASLISYRELFGNLISVFELQAVPLWTVPLIQRLLPFITVGQSITIKDDFTTRVRRGEHSIMLRAGRALEESAGFSQRSNGKAFEGGPLKIFVRYRYTYKNLLSVGVLGEKDAGESLFSGSQKRGFDFYSFHLFMRKIASLDMLAIGDFTVNLGQGLIQWQSLAFKKSADITAIKRQSPVFRPYNSAGEFNFHRGMAVAMSRGRFHGAAFISFRNHSAATDVNEQGNEIFTSFQTSGNHRTVNEIAAKKQVKVKVLGGRVGFAGRKFSLTANAVAHQFSLPWEKKEEPYNFYSIKGKTWFNASLDYAWTFRNVHLFGELAIDQKMSRALVSGFLVSLDNKTDLSIVYRNIAPAYQAINANAFTESSIPSNERGLYLGVNCRPGRGWKLDGYFDIYQFPFLKYQVDAPSSGREYLLQAVYTLSKTIELSLRFRNEMKLGNAGDEDSVMSYISGARKKNLRCQVQQKINGVLTVRFRIEGSWYQPEKGKGGTGSMFFADVAYKPMGRRWSGNLRLLYFGTDGYNSRLYSYESDVLFANSIPAFFDHGVRYYINVSYDLTKNVTMWLKIARTGYSGKSAIGSGLDEIAGSCKTDFNFQIRYNL